MKKIIIAIDGFSSCGKSTMAKALAKQLNYDYIDSGAMYRVVTLFAIENGMIKDGEIDTEALKRRINDIHIDFSYDERGQHITLLNGRNVEKEIRTPEISDFVSPISAIGFVREKMTEQQRKFGERKGIVMDGRDIGTTVFPQAELKIFVVAKPDVRAQRRYDELKAKGISITFEDVLKNLTERDRIDSTRAVSPLAKAKDAIEVDNSDLTIAEQDALLLSMAHKAIEKAQ